MNGEHFKDVSKKVVIKQKYNNFILNNIDEKIAIERLEKFIRKYQFIVSNNLDVYMNGTNSRFNRSVVTITKIIVLIVALRFAISALFPSQRMRALMGDSNYLIGHPFLISIMMSICAFVILFIGLVIQIQESHKCCSFMNLLYWVKYKQLPLSLSPVHYRRFILHSNLLTKYLLKQAFWPLVIITNGFMFGATVLAYLDPNSGFNLVSLIFWPIMTFIWTVQFYGIVSFGFIIWFMASTYLKYKFNEINEQIRISLKLKQVTSLQHCIRLHNLVTKLTKELNGFFSYMLFVLYYFATPALEILIYLSHDKHTYIFARFAAVFIFVLVFGTVFMLNLMSTWITKEAHKSLPLLHSFMNATRLRNYQSLKVMAFIEKLSGPEIGFYCYNMFPMNNYEFYQYVSITVANYFLILGLVKQIV